MYNNHKVSRMLVHYYKTVQYSTNNSSNSVKRKVKCFNYCFSGHSLEIHRFVERACSNMVWCVLKYSLQTHSTHLSFVKMFCSLHLHLWCSTEIQWLYEVWQLTPNAKMHPLDRLWCCMEYKSFCASWNVILYYTANEQDSRAGLNAKKRPSYHTKQTKPGHLGYPYQMHFPCSVFPTADVGVFHDESVLQYITMFFNG